MKSYVTVEQHLCIVCGKPFDTGAILLDKRMKDRFEHTTLTGNGLCPEHKKLHDEGYIAMVEVDPTKSTVPEGNLMKPEDAYRTGKIAHIRREVYGKVFVNVPTPDGPMAFCESDVMKYLESLMPKE